MQAIPQLDTCQQWFTVRLKPRRTSAYINARYEAVKSRGGLETGRRVAGTGARMMVQEVLLRRAGLPCKTMGFASRWKPTRKGWRRPVPPMLSAGPSRER